MIYKKFRYNDSRKIFPVLFTRTNYGYSPTDIAQSDNIQHKVLTITFPESEVFSVFLIRTDGDSNLIEDVKLAGINSSVEFNIEEQNSYKIFVMSKNYNDGYISSEYSIKMTDELEITYSLIESGDIPTTIRLENNGRLTKTYNSTDRTQWYNYQGNYDGPLLWQYGSTIDLDANYSYILPKREMLTTMKLFFETLDVYELKSCSTKHHAVAFLKIISDTYHYLLTDEVLEYVRIYPEINAFVQTINNFIEIITDNKLSIDSTTGLYADMYNFVEKKFFMDSFNEYGWDSLEQWDSWDGAAVAYYEEDVREKVISTTPDTFNIKFGGVDVYDAYKAFTLELSSDYNYKKNVGIAIHNYNFDGVSGQYKVCDNYFSSLDVPHSTTVSDSRGINIPNYVEDTELKTYSFSIGNRVIEQLRSYITQEYDELQNIINTLGDYIFTQQNTFDPNNFDVQSYETKIQTMIAAISDISEYALLGGYLNMSQIVDGGDSEIGMDDIERSKEAAVEINSDINDVDSEVKNLPIVIASLTRSKDYSIGLLDLMYGDETISQQTYQSYFDVLTNMSYYSRVYDYYVNYSEYNDSNDSSELQYPQLAQEAILQNIRFINTVLNSGINDVFTQVGNSVSTIMDNIKILKDSVLSSVSTFTISNKIERNPNPSDISFDMVKYCDESNILSTPIDVTNSVRIENSFVRLPNINQLGKYRLKIYPKKIVGSIYDYNQFGVYSRFSNYPEITGTTNNSFYGWNARIIGPLGQQIGSEKIIASSSYNVETGYYLKLTPENSSETGIYNNSNIEIWSNSFDPIIVDIDIVEHDEETLSYYMYGGKEFNTDNGLLTIYDHNGNVYKTFTIGQRALPSEGNSIIEFRTPNE